MNRVPPHLGSLPSVCGRSDTAPRVRSGSLNPDLVERFRNLIGEREDFDPIDPAEIVRLFRLIGETHDFFRRIRYRDRIVELCREIEQVFSFVEPVQQVVGRVFLLTAFRKSVSLAVGDGPFLGNEVLDRLAVVSYGTDSTAPGGEDVRTLFAKELHVLVA